MIGRVAQEVLTDAFIGEVVAAANRFLDELPDTNVAEDTKALETQLRKKESAAASSRAAAACCDRDRTEQPRNRRVSVR